MPILWSEEYLTDVRIIPILTQRDIGVDRTLALLIWLIENVDFAFVFSPSQSEQALFGLLAYRKRLYKHRRIGMASESDGPVMLKGAYNATGGLVLGLSAQRDIRQKGMPLS